MTTEYLTEAQAAKMLQVSRSTLWHLRKHDGLPHIRIGSATIRYRPHDLDEWLAAHYTINGSKNT